MPVFVSTFVLMSACSGHALPPTGATATSAKLLPPPAVSGIDDTVSVKWALADSFDVLPDGTCAGRSNFRGITNGAQALLRGNGTGFDVETRANTHVERWQPQISHGKPLLNDDYVYCAVDAVFAPSMPDPEGYSVKFAEADQWVWLGKPGGRPFGQLDKPGYGSYRITSQACPSLLDPPEKDC
jgi:hypothetical protein